MTRFRLPRMMSLEGFAEEVARTISIELRVCTPARVLEYMPPVPGPRPTPPRARVRLDHLMVRECEPGDKHTHELVVPPNNPDDVSLVSGEYVEGSLIVPVHFPGGWGGWSRGALLPGEQGKLVFTDRSLDAWQIDGGVGEPFDPVFEHTHGFNLCDAFFEPGVRSGIGMLTPPTVPDASEPLGPSSIPADGSAWGLADGTAGIKVRHPTGNPLTQRDIEVLTTGMLVTIDAASKIKAGTTTFPLAKAQQVQDIFDQFAQDITTWVPPIAPVIDNGLALKTLMLASVVPLIQALSALIATTKLEGE